MSSKGNWRSFRQKSLTQSGKRSIESLLTPAGLLAESLQSLQELGRIVFQPDLAHNFHKPSFVSVSQHFCQVKFRFLRCSVSRRFLRIPRRFSSSITRRISSSCGNCLQCSSSAAHSITLQLAKTQVSNCENDSTRDLDRVDHTGDARDFCDIVDADDVCAIENANSHCRDGAEDSFVRRQRRLSWLR